MASYDNASQAKLGHGYGNENGLRSHIWTKSPLAKNSQIPGHRIKVTDACQFGKQDSHGNPQLKSYRLDTMLSWPNVFAVAKDMD